MPRAASRSRRAKQACKERRLSARRARLRVCCGHSLLLHTHTVYLSTCMQARQRRRSPLTAPAPMCLPARLCMADDGDRARPGMHCSSPPSPCRGCIRQLTTACVASTSDCQPSVQLAGHMVQKGGTRAEDDRRRRLGGRSLSGPGRRRRRRRDGCAATLPGHRSLACVHRSQQPHTQAAAAGTTRKLTRAWRPAQPAC